MMISMTGFGQSQTEKKGERFLVTLKSVNHKYFETMFHLPLGIDYLEAFFRSKVQAKIKRGRINITIVHMNESPDVVVLNEALMAKYFTVMEKTKKKFELNEPLHVSDLISLPGVITSKKDELNMEEREACLKKAMEEALVKLIAMRKREGQALACDLSQRIRRIATHIVSIKKIVAKTRSEKKKALPAEEFESFLRSTDVSEELTRIDFHLKSFLKQMKTAEPKGKVLDFVGQELQREINTLGAKVQDKHVAYQVIMVKDQIEKIREQVQNVE